MADDHGPWLSTATALFFSWALLSLSVRIWMKLGRKQKWTHSDSAVSAAFFVALLHVSSNFWAIHRGYGKPRADIEDSQLGNVEGALFTSQISYIVSIGLTRVSTAFFIANLTRHRPQLRISYALAGASCVWTLAAVLVVALRGDLAHPWETLDGSQALYIRWIAVEAVGLALEIALMAMSFALIGGLQMKLQKRALILSAFGARLLIMPIIAVRLYYLAPAQNPDPTSSTIISGILTEGAMEFALMATSITALKPFLTPFHTGAIVNSVGGAGSGIYSGTRSKPQGVYMLSSVSGKHDKGQTTMTIESGNHDHKFNRSGGTNKAQPHAHAHAHTNGHADGRRDDIESMESNGSERMIIQTTRDWSVRYEDK